MSSQNMHQVRCSMLFTIENCFLSQILPTILCVLSLGSSVSLLATYRKFLRIRLRSGILLILISICEFVMTLCWMLSLYYSTKSAAPSVFLIAKSTCLGIGVVQVFSYLLYLFLNLCLIHAFALTTKDVVLNPPNRLKKYIIWSVVAAFGLTLAAALSNGIMESPYGFCGATATSIIQYLSFIWILLVDPIVLLVLFRFHRKQRDWYTELDTGLIDTYTREIRKSFIKTNTGSILLFVVGWFMFHFLNILFFLGVGQRTEGSVTLAFFTIMGFYAIILISFFMMLIRLTDPLLKKVIRRFVRNQLQPQQNDIHKFLLGEPTNSTFFTDVQRRSFKLRDASGANLGKDVMSFHSEIPMTVHEPVQRNQSEHKRIDSLAMSHPITLQEYRLILHCLEQLINTDTASIEKLENIGQIPWCTYFYTHITHKRLSPPNESFANINSTESFTKEDSINTYVHSDSVFEHLAYIFGLKREEIIESISLRANEKNLQENYQLCISQKVGFYKNYHFKSSDEKILFQIIDKEQKFKIVENYLQMYHEHVVSDNGNLLPQLLGLYTIDLVNRKYIVLLLKNSYQVFNENTERKLTVKKRILIDADYIRIEVLNSDGSIHSRNKIQIIRENSQVSLEIEKLIEMAPDDKARLLDIMRMNLKFLDKAQIVWYKIVFILSCLPSQERLEYEKPRGTGNNEFISNLKTTSGDKISVFYELDNYFRPNIGKETRCTSAVFSKEDPAIYRQCIDETLYQYL